MASRHTKLSPRNARKAAQLRTIVNKKRTPNGWVLVEHDVVAICQQMDGFPPTGSVILPRRQFDTIVRWYQADQKVTP